jgi:hypothetical protein
VRGPVLLGIVAMLLLMALPIYLWRRPKPMAVPRLEEVARAEVDRGGSVVGPGPGAGAAVAVADAGAGKKLMLLEPRVVRCFHQGGGRVSGERCDSPAPFQDMLARAIRDNLPCAPPTASSYTVSFVLSVDFERKSTHLWAGRSGSLKKRNAADLIRCIEHAIAPPDWGTTHQHAKYDINIVASYPGAGAI